MNEFNVLLGAATNGTPSGSLFDALFARYIAPQESWRELESPLPITILSAGEDLIDYRIYGNTENSESVGERTENLFDNDTVTKQSFINSYTGELENYPYYDTTAMMDVENDFIITFVQNVSGKPIPLRVGFYDAQNNFISYYHTVRASSPLKVTIPTRTKKVRVSYTNELYLGPAYLKDLFIGLTAPTSYIPYGYKLPMVVTNGTTTTTTPIYIGSDPLAEDEYVDFVEQKIYRMEGGTLTPTDPPVPIPALPTIRGKTIIDYNPSEAPAVEPEKMYVKYKP